MRSALPFSWAASAAKRPYGVTLSHADTDKSSAPLIKGMAKVSGLIWQHVFARVDREGVGCVQKPLIICREVRVTLPSRASPSGNHSLGIIMAVTE